LFLIVQNCLFFKNINILVSTRFEEGGGEGAKETWEQEGVDREGKRDRGVRLG